MATGTNSKSIVLLWTNSAPTTEFDSKTVEVDLSGYSFVFIIAAATPTYPYQVTRIAPIGMDSSLWTFADFNASTGRMLSRIFKATSAGVTFGQAFRRSIASTSAASAGNTYLIPQYIYGIRG